MSDVRVRIRSTGDEGPATPEELARYGEVVAMLERVLPFGTLREHDEIQCTLRITNSTIASVDWVFSDERLDNYRGTDAHRAYVDRGHGIEMIRKAEVERGKGRVWDEIQEALAAAGGELEQLGWKPNRAAVGVWDLTVWTRWRSVTVSVTEGELEAVSAGGCLPKDLVASIEHSCSGRADPRVAGAAQ